MAPSNSPKPWRALGVLALIIVAMAAGMIGTNTYIPKLGLDLSGGTTVTLTPVTEKGKTPPESNVQKAVDIIRQRVNAFGVSEAEVTQQGENIVVSVPGQGQNKVVQQVGQTAQLRFRQVLLTQPATPASTPSPTSSPGGSGASGDKSSGDKDTQGSEGAKTSGPSSTSGSASGSASEAPSQSRAVSRALQEEPGSGSGGSNSGGSGGGSGSGQDSGSGAAPSQPSQQELLQQLQQRQAAQQMTSDIDKDVLKKFRNFECEPGASRGRLLEPQKQAVACDKQGTAKYVLGEAKILGTMVSNARAGLPPQGQAGGWMVQLEFNGTGAQRFADITKRVYQKPAPRNQVAIVLDGVVVSAPRIQEPIPGGGATITGNFNQQQAEDLSTILRYGALPLQFNKSEIQHVSPTLGADQLRGGIIAGAIGLALVVLYSLLFYRGLGIVSVFGLMVAMGMSYAAVVLLGIVMGYRLSLAGIAGLIVAIGITVDSFVVYFERLRDEIRDGRSPRSAVERSWLRARRTILTADTVSFLAAAVLWIVSVGDVKGFAFTLGLTTLIDILVVFIFTKPLLTAFARTRFFGEGHALSGLDPRRLGARAPAAAATEGVSRPRTRTREA